MRHFFSIELVREKCKNNVAGSTDEEPIVSDICRCDKSGLWDLLQIGADVTIFHYGAHWHL